MTRLFEAKPFVVAEVGSNWETLSHCLESIVAAKEAGADAVKFQAFTYRDLFGSFPEGKLDVTLPHELPLSWLPELKAAADTCGIEFMCTAFSPELVAAVDPYVEVHKIASSCAAWPQLLEAVAAASSNAAQTPAGTKPILISFGGKSATERKAAVDFLQSECHYGRDDVVPLYCVASYPADYVDLPDFSPHSGYDGFSDHTLGITAAVVAARRGAIVIEKHFTAFPDLDTPDRPHSLTPNQFKRMIDIIRDRPDNGEESDMYRRHTRRLVATSDIAEGDVFKYGENYGAYRALEDDTRGLSPFAWKTVEGKLATLEIKRGQAIGDGDFA